MVSDPFSYGMATGPKQERKVVCTYGDLIQALDRHIEQRVTDSTRPHVNVRSRKVANICDILKGKLGEAPSRPIMNKAIHLNMTAEELGTYTVPPSRYQVVANIFRELTAATGIDFYFRGERGFDCSNCIGSSGYASKLFAKKS